MKYIVDFFFLYKEIILFFIVTTLNQLVGTLRSIFVANKAGMLSYITVAIDALLYAFIVNALSAQTWITILLFVIGKIFGTFLGNVIESKIAIGIYDIEIYVGDHEKQKILQNKLLENGFSSTMNIGTISKNDVRWSINVHLKRRDMDKFYKILSDIGINNPTMVVRQARKVTGKIMEHI